MGSNCRSGRCQKGARENKIRSDSTVECAAKKICEGRRDHQHKSSSGRELGNIDICRRDAGTVRDYVGDTNAVPNWSVDAQAGDDPAKIGYGRTINDTVSDFDADFVGIGFTDCFGTSRTITWSKRDTGAANDAECNTQTGGIEFAHSNGHYFFNSDSSAFGIDDRDGWRRARKIAAREIQISSTKI